MLSVAIGDVNGDGKPDLMVASGCSRTTAGCPKGTISVLLGNGDGMFRPPVAYDSGGYGANAVAVADVSGDGKLDLVVANSCDSSTNGNCAFFTPGVVGVLLGNGDGTFEAPQTYGSGGYWISDFVAVADVNGDSRPDLLVVNLLGLQQDHGSVGVLLNNIPFDTRPPVITLSATPRVLWPPSGKMVAVRFSGAITDTGSGVDAKSVAYAVKDEYGEVQPHGSVTLAAGGTYSFTILLEASRRGQDKDGRRYTITIQAKDNAGNLASEGSVVTVVHDQGH